ncbi:hypothetical protein [Hoeflea olei]|uniref:Uncharacterized protein n=1 Tax=Hoeflea olei TaxID=1480615 RepID=A0A1C1Z1F8_9HYPH|nr:hypothetical protein [Hoeflea olei]OCW59560.1 hypothetical protein AWJ14_11160 [Hoeflea olei]
MTAPLPDAPVYLSYWRAALLAVFALPFATGALALMVAAFDARSVSAFATAAFAASCLMAVTLMVVSWLVRYRRSRGPMYVFTADGLIVARHFGGNPIPWQDVWISSSMPLRAGLITVNVDYRKPEFRSDPHRRSLAYFETDRHKTMRRIVMPNIATLRGGELRRRLIAYVRASGTDLPTGV